MKKHVLILQAIVGALLFSSWTYAMDPPVASYGSFEAYELAMLQKGLPKTLIVGCGHGPVYAHSHSDSWCTNLKVDPSLKGFPQNTPDVFKESVQYDEILDIRESHLRKKEVLVRDSDPKSNILKYKNKFDVVLLERPLPNTLNMPWTLWNAVHMLKVGGELIVDSCDGYNSDLYRLAADNKFSPVCAPDNASPYGENFNPANISKKYVNFGIKLAPKENNDMVTMAHYLARWHLIDIINVQEAYSFYTAGNLKEARLTRILSATKTQKTEDALEEWAKKIQDVRGTALLSYR